MDELSNNVPNEHNLNTLTHEISIKHTNDQNTLLDVHVGNPLRKITQLLEEIKKQKAFSFTLKGSLGVAGIAAVLVTFGLFGGTHALCSRGTQAHVGILRRLSYAEMTNDSLFVRVENIWRVVTGSAPLVAKEKAWNILLKNDGSAIHLITDSRNDTTQLTNQYLVAVGEYDVCSQTLTLNAPHSMESLQ